MIRQAVERLGVQHGRRRLCAGSGTRFRILGSRSGTSYLFPGIRSLSSSTLDGEDPSSRPTSTTNKADDAVGNKWRKQQLDKLEKKFQPPSATTAEVESSVQDDEDLQPMWKDMESRVKNRRSRTLAENKGKIGRTNVRKTDEDVWLEQGLYDDIDDADQNQKDEKKS